MKFSCMDLAVDKHGDNSWALEKVTSVTNFDTEDHRRTLTIAHRNRKHIPQFGKDVNLLLRTVSSLRQLWHNHHTTLPYGDHTKARRDP